MQYLAAIFLPAKNMFGNMILQNHILDPEWQWFSLEMHGYWEA